jgi:hypothetical protein
MIVIRYYFCAASQMWCLGRYLPIIIGDVIPEGYMYWEYYLTHLDIMDEVQWDTLSSTSSTSCAFCDFVFDNSLIQLIDKPTHVQGNILDLASAFQL